jgi:DNA-binding CsgD family transcriptional regulator
MTGSDDAKPDLTERQLQIVVLIARGCSNDEVGQRLGISPRTAKAHCDVLRQKLGVPRRRQIPAAFKALTGEDPLARELAQTLWRVGPRPQQSGTRPSDAFPPRCRRPDSHPVSQSLDAPQFLNHPPTLLEDELVAALPRKVMEERMRTLRPTGLGRDD